MWGEVKSMHKGAIGQPKVPTKVPTSKSPIGKGLVRVPLDYYRILNLPPQASNEQLDQAYRDRTLQLPRREYSEEAIAAYRHLLYQAYQILSDPQQRETYDQNFLASAQPFLPESLPLIPETEDLAQAKDHSDEETPPTLAPEGTPVQKTRLHSSLQASAGSSPSPEGTQHTISSAPPSTLLNLSHLVNSQEQEEDSVESTPQAKVGSLFGGAMPSIEIQGHQLIGALVLLQELGEYELVLQLGIPALKRHRFADKDPGSDRVALKDITLTLALTYLELGREQWQQHQYEIAAASLQAGHKVLAEEDFFPVIDAEVQADLKRLRPYRILHLMALPLDSAAERHTGWTLLQQMLQERGGIEGTGPDGSGLTVQGLLRFLQQLREHLTVEEQRTLFLAESQRPSPTATYLAVYALLAEGFATFRPQRIYQAKPLLKTLGDRQDVHLEGAVCTLLLGQTDEALHHLELGGDPDCLAFIQEHSEGSPDWLPGLCRYADYWLKTEVLPHFRDLADCSVALNTYFADPDVQTYLETLSETLSETLNETLEAPGSPESFEGVTDEGRLDRPPETPLSTPETTARPRFSFHHRGRNSRRKRSNKERSSPPTQQTGDRPFLTFLNGLPFFSSSTRSPSHSQRAQKGGLGIILGGLFVLGLIGMGSVWGVRTYFGTQGNPSSKTDDLPTEPVAPVLEPFPSESSTTPASSETSSETLTETTAQALVESWLSAKAIALGPEHSSEQLSKVLADPLLTEQKLRADADRQQSRHSRYEHGPVTIISVELDPDNPEQGTVVADVQEKTTYFEQNQPIDSSEDQLRVRYNLVRQDGAWRIRKIEVL